MLTLVCFLEEPSARECLQVLLERLFPDDTVCFQPIVFNGKKDLDKNIEKRLKGYRTPNACFLILRDQDSENCQQIKQQLLNKVDSAGKSNHTLIRIACRELESFYLGDLQAVAKGLELPNLATYQDKAKFRNPDTLKAAFELSRLTQKKYKKLAGSRSISPHLNLQGINTSTSFQVLISGLSGFVNNQKQHFGIP